MSLTGLVETEKTTFLPVDKRYNIMSPTDYNHSH